MQLVHANTLQLTRHGELIKTKRRKIWRVWNFCSWPERLVDKFSLWWKWRVEYITSIINWPCPHRVRYRRVKKCKRGMGRWQQLCISSAIVETLVNVNNAFMLILISISISKSKGCEIFVVDSTCFNHYISVWILSKIKSWSELKLNNPKHSLLI